MAFVVFAGQSNMGGAFMDASTLSEPWAPDPLTLVWDVEARAWTAMRPGENTGYGQQPKAWGPEVAFARAFRAQFPDETLHIVKYAHGGASLAVDPGQWIYDWSPDSPDEWFDRTAKIVAEAGSSMGGARPDAVFFGQGETDAEDAADAQAYAENLTDFLAAVRAEWMGDPAGRIGFFRIGISPEFAADVRQAQAEVDQTDARAASFDTAAYPMQPDNLHFAAAGYDMAGEEFFGLLEAWRATDGGAASGQVLAGSEAADTLIGGAGNDTVEGGGGRNYLRGDAGDDVIQGGPAFDDVHGNMGDDTVYGGGGDDWVVGGKDDDRLFGDEGSDIVWGNLGADTQEGGDGIDQVRGGQADDVLDGGAGDDWLAGDRGNDTVAGGAGADIFHTWAEAGLDRVTDFNAAEGDRVNLLPGTSYSVAQVGADTVIDMGGDNRMVLVGVQMSSLPEGWIFGA